MRVAAADGAIIRLTAATNFIGYDKLGGDPSAQCELVLSKSQSKTLGDILKDHNLDYESLFNRVSLDLGHSATSNKPTDIRLRDFRNGNDPALAALLFQYGRYLLISSSREGGQPANSQGIWNDSLNPPWDSKYTCNINTEMNYWPALTTNLAECQTPLDDAITDLTHTGAAVAKEQYGARAGSRTTTSTSGAARPPSTPPTTASGSPAGPGSASTFGNNTCSRAIRSSWPKKPIRP